MSRNMKISIGFIAVFIGLSLLGLLFGDGLTSPAPATADLEFSMPNNMVLVAPAGEVRREFDPLTNKNKMIAPNGFRILREVPTEFGQAETDPCDTQEPPPPKMELKDVRTETHWGAVAAADIEEETKGNQVYVRVPNGGTLVERMISFQGLWTWFAALLTLCILSFLYDDNPFYKFAEHLFIGVSAAYWMVIGFWTVMVPNLLGKLWPSFVARINPGIGDVERSLIYLIPLLFGVILLFRLSNKLGWVSRWALAFIVGTTAGLNFVGYLQSDFVGQIEGAIGSLIVVDPTTGFSLGGTFNAVVMLVGVLTSLIYFFFSSEHKGVMGVGSRVGIWVLMITFGASFGYTVMGRIALLVGQMEFLFADWLHIIIN
ncbi:MAG TPA: hypothetical protein PK961_07045 [bacterium]|nr:hypothetical protein [bacterium]